MPKRVAVYVDGFNLYHAIDELRDNQLKWLDLWQLGESFCEDDEVLTNVYYFTAYATWRPDAHKRHRDYVKAVQAQGVKAVIGTFKAKPAKCKTCGAVWTSHEEKETDVHIAVQIIHDAHLAVWEKLGEDEGIFPRPIGPRMLWRHY